MLAREGFVFMCWGLCVALKQTPLKLEHRAEMQFQFPNTCDTFCFVSSRVGFCGARYGVSRGGFNQGEQTTVSLEDII